MIGILASYSRALQLGREPKLGLRARIMRLLESDGAKRTTTDIWRALKADPTCVRNLMARLRQGGWVRYERDGHGFVYWVPR